MHAAKWGLEVRRLLKEQHVVSVALEENVRALLLRAEDEGLGSFAAGLSGAAGRARVGAENEEALSISARMPSLSALPCAGGAREFAGLQRCPVRS